MKLQLVLINDFYYDKVLLNVSLFSDLDDYVILNYLYDNIYFNFLVICIFIMYIVYVLFYYKIKMIL